MAVLATSKVVFEEKMVDSLNTKEGWIDYDVHKWWKKKSFSLVYFQKCGKSRSIRSLLQGVLTKSGNHLSYFDILASPLTFVEHSVEPLKATSTQLNPKSNFFFFFLKRLELSMTTSEIKAISRSLCRTWCFKNYIVVEKCSLFSCGLFFLFIALEKPLVCTGATKELVKKNFSDVVFFSATFLFSFFLHKSINYAAFWHQPKHVGGFVWRWCQTIPLE